MSARRLLPTKAHVASGMQGAGPTTRDRRVLIFFSTCVSVCLCACAASCVERESWASEASRRVERRLITCARETYERPPHRKKIAEALPVRENEKNRRLNKRRMQNHPATTDARERRIAHKLLSRYNVLPRRYDWRNTVALQGAPTEPSELVNPREVEATQQRLLDDKDFRDTTMRHMRATDTRFYLSRWDKRHRLSGDERRRRKRLIDDRERRRRALLAQLMPRTVDPSEQRAVEASSSSSPESVPTLLAVDEERPKIDPVAVPATTPSDDVVAPAPDSAASSVRTATWDEPVAPMVPDESPRHSFLALATSTRVQPVRGEFREGFPEMYGLVATTGIAAGELIVTWPGVDVDEPTFVASLPHLCNRSHVMEYAMTYSPHENATARVVCPRLTAEGRPSPTAVGEFDACWACFINEPMLHARVKLKGTVLHRRVTKKRVKANARYVVSGGRPVVVACEDITPGDEITMRYADGRGYSKGLYTPGEHASVGKCPVGPSEYEWTETDRPSPPLPIHVRYLAPSDHARAHELREAMDRREEAELDAKRVRRETERSYPVRRAAIGDVEWTVVRARRKSCLDTLLSLDHRPTVRRTRVLLFVLLFAPLDEFPEWEADVRRRFREQTARSTRTLLNGTIEDVWKQLTTLGADAKLRVVRSRPTELEELLHEFPEEPEIVDAERRLSALDATLQDLTDFLQLHRTAAVGEAFEQYHSMWQTRVDRRSLTGGVDEAIATSA